MVEHEEVVVVQTLVSRLFWLELSARQSKLPRIANFYYTTLKYKRVIELAVSHRSLYNRNPGTQLLWLQVQHPGYCGQALSSPRPLLPDNAFE